VEVCSEPKRKEREKGEERELRELCAARRRGNASSTSASDITGSDYSDGFRDGFLQRNGSVVRELTLKRS